MIWSQTYQRSANDVSGGAIFWPSTPSASPSVVSLREGSSSTRSRSSSGVGAQSSTRPSSGGEAEQSVTGLEETGGKGPGVAAEEPSEDMGNTAVLVWGF